MFDHSLYRDSRNKLYKKTAKHKKPLFLALPDTFSKFALVEVLIYH